jgi:ribulose kinase|tara:strand:- start:22 stop:165 length:144 start_codon:yes stop_codon:yes gene_type:complete
MDDKYVIGVDYGTASVRSILVNALERRIGLVIYPFQQHSSKRKTDLN